MVKLVDLNESLGDDLNYDIVEDVVVFMRNDPMFYRKQYFPAISKMADLTRAGEKCNKHSLLSNMIEQGITEYCRKYKVSEMPDEVFTLEDRHTLMSKIFSEEMEEIQKGEYK
jgi:hypothetical protein